MEEEQRMQPSKYQFQYMKNALATSTWLPSLPKELMRTALPMLDEFVMFQDHNQEAVDCSLHDALCSDLLVGGIVVSWVRDFRQILPFVGAVNRSQILSTCFWSLHLFLLFKPISWELWQRRIDSGESNSYRAKISAPVYQFQSFWDDSWNPKRVSQCW